MILIADSGGSKTDWRFIQKDGSIGQANAQGFNAYYQPIEDLKKSIKESVLPAVKENVTRYFFMARAHRPSTADRNAFTCHRWRRSWFHHRVVDGTIAEPFASRGRLSL